MTAPFALALVVACAPARVAAQAELCAFAFEGQAFEGYVVGVGYEVGVLDSVDPAELESPDPQAVVPSPVPTRRERPRSVLWCSGHDDPRCAPLHDGDPPLPSSLPGGPLATLPQPATLPAVGFVVPVRTPGATLGSSSGVALRVERPPRG